MKKIFATMVILCLALTAYGRNDKEYNKNQLKKSQLKNSIPDKTNYVSPLWAKFEANKPKPPMKGKFQPSEFDVTPLNSPVKGNIAKFLLKVPKNFEITQVKFKVKKASHILLKEKDYSLTKLVDTTEGKQLHISLEDPTSGFYRLYVKVKIKKDKNEEHLYRSAYHDYVRFVVAEKANGVPMPDSTENKATIAGVDSDKNGIRDDIQIWINEEFEERPIVKLALEQLARDMQTELVNSNTEELSKIATIKALDSSICLSSIIGLDEKIIQQKRLKERMLNTKMRLDADTRVNANFSGSKYSISIEPEYMKSTCDFSY